MSPATLRRFLSLWLSGLLLFAVSPAHGEEHRAPRGGTLLELGDEFAQIEFVLDLQQGDLTTYILDGEAENPVRIHQPSIDLQVDEASYAGVNKATFTLHLKAMANVLTGETVGDTSEFDVHSPESLQGATSIKGKIKRIAIRSQVFNDVPFTVALHEASNPKRAHRDRALISVIWKARGFLIPGLVGLLGLLIAQWAAPKRFRQIQSLPMSSSTGLPLTGPGPHDPPVFQDGYRVISFTILGNFNYRSKRDTLRPRRIPLFSEGPPTHLLPAYVKALNGQRVMLQGYMMPIVFDDKELKSFAVLPHMASCCFGGAPKMNLWVYVTTGPHTRNQYDTIDSGVPVTAYGTLEVGEKDNDDVGTSLYRIKADKIVVPSS